MNIPWDCSNVTLKCEAQFTNPFLYLQIHILYYMMIDLWICSPYVKWPQPNARFFFSFALLCAFVCRNCSTTGSTIWLVAVQAVSSPGRQRRPS